MKYSYLSNIYTEESDKLSYRHQDASDSRNASNVFRRIQRRRPSLKKGVSGNYNYD